MRYFIILYHNKMTYGYKGNHQPEICHAGCVFGQVAAMPDGSLIPLRLAVRFRPLLSLSQRGASKESIKRRGTAGTFGRPVSSYEWHF